MILGSDGAVQVLGILIVLVADVLRHVEVGFERGVAVDDPRLGDTNVLNPEWVTNGIYKIINSNLLFHSKGQLDYSLLNQIFNNDTKYPIEKWPFIIDMMKKFE